MMDKEFNLRYRDILTEKVKVGLDLLEKTSIKELSYQKLIVNINNSLSIISGLNYDIDGPQLMEPIQPETPIDPQVEELPKEE